MLTDWCRLSFILSKLEYYHAAQKLYISEREPMGLAYTCAALARVFTARNQLDVSRKYLKEALSAARDSNNPRVVEYVKNTAQELNIQLEDE